MGQSSQSSQPSQPLGSRVSGGCGTAWTGFSLLLLRTPSAPPPSLSSLLTKNSLPSLRGALSFLDPQSFLPVLVAVTFSVQTSIILYLEGYQLQDRLFVLPILKKSTISSTPGIHQCRFTGHIISKKLRSGIDCLNPHVEHELLWSAHFLTVLHIHHQAHHAFHHIFCGVPRRLGLCQASAR